MFRLSKVDGAITGGGFETKFRGGKNLGDMFFPTASRFGMGRCGDAGGGDGIVFMTMLRWSWWFKKDAGADKIYTSGEVE
jgi:hypothetical protein